MWVGDACGLDCIYELSPAGVSVSAVEGIPLHNRSPALSKPCIAYLLYSPVAAPRRKVTSEFDRFFTSPKNSFCKYLYRSFLIHECVCVCSG